MSTNFVPDDEVFGLAPEPTDAESAFEDFEVEEPQDLGKDLQFDFIRGAFAVSPSNWLQQADEAQALVQWITVALITRRGSTVIYPGEFGSDLHELLGGSQRPQEIASEIPAMIEDALLVHDRIDSIRNVEFELSQDGLLTINFDVILDDDATLAFQASLPIGI
jgi:phage baseplate assembly protein W